nr:MAG TPA: hypothetical protein [Caudoviricetes sp.]
MCICAISLYKLFNIIIFKIFIYKLIFHITS